MASGTETIYFQTVVSPSPSSGGGAGGSACSAKTVRTATVQAADGQCASGSLNVTSVEFQNPAAFTVNESWHTARRLHVRWSQVKIPNTSPCNVAADKCSVRYAGSGGWTEVFYESTKTTSTDNTVTFSLPLTTILSAANRPLFKVFLAQYNSAKNPCGSACVQTNPLYVLDVWIEIDYTEPTGACCNGTSCSIATEAACAGTYLGDGTTCTGDPCAPDPPPASPEYPMAGGGIVT